MPDAELLFQPYKQVFSGHVSFSFLFGVGTTESLNFETWLLGQMPCFPFSPTFNHLSIIQLLPWKWLSFPILLSLLFTGHSESLFLISQLASLKSILQASEDFFLKGVLDKSKGTKSLALTPNTRSQVLYILDKLEYSRHLHFTFSI